MFSDRISTWFVETLTRSAAAKPGGGDAPLVLLDAVEHDDGVVQRVAEDREEGDHRRRRDLEAEHRVDARREMTTSWIIATIAATAIRHSKRIEMTMEISSEEHEQGDDRLARDLLAPRRRHRRRR